MNLKQNAKQWVLVLIAIILIGLAIYGSRHQFKPTQGKIMLKYKVFESKNPALNFTFEYPEVGWTPVESQGRTEKYDLVYLSGPIDKEHGFTTLIHITEKPLKPNETSATLLERYLKMDSNLDKFKTLRKENKMVAGEQAASALYEYEATPLYRIKASPVLVKGKKIYLTRNGRSYEFTLETIGSQYNIYAPILEHVLTTFKFTE